MQISCAFPPSPNVVAHAQLAESLGYERIWLYDSPALYPDVWVSLARVAEHTTRIGIGPGVLVPNLRHPALKWDGTWAPLPDYLLTAARWRERAWGFPNCLNISKTASHGITFAKLLP